MGFKASLGRGFRVLTSRVYWGPTRSMSQPSTRIGTHDLMRLGLHAFKIEVKSLRLFGAGLIDYRV